MVSAHRREAKPSWSMVPGAVQREVGRVLGAPVARAVRAYGGYAPSATFRLLLADGRCSFFKGVYPLPASSPVQWSLTEEERVYRELGQFIRPWAPAYLGSVQADGWHALLLEDLGGRSMLPWTVAKAEQAARSYAEFHRTTYGQPLPTWVARDRHLRFGAYWHQLAAEEGALDRVASLAGPEVEAAREWLAESLPALRQAAELLMNVPEPLVLMHFDTRSDNVRLQGELLRIFDWPWAAVGPHEFELAAFAQSIEAEGGPRSEEVARWYTSVLELRPSLLEASIAGIAGYFAWHAPRPSVEELPRLRSVQRRQLKASLGWAARTLCLPDPTWLAAVSD